MEEPNSDQHTGIQEIEGEIKEELYDQLKNMTEYKSVIS